MVKYLSTFFRLDKSVQVMLVDPDSGALAESNGISLHEDRLFLNKEK
jgi:hypothetical protein